MKKLTKPTRSQRKIIQEHGLDAHDWYVERIANGTIYIVNKVGEKMVLDLEDE